MNTMKTKLLTLMFAAVLLAGSGIAVQGYDGGYGQPHIMDAPSNEAPNGTTPNATLPSLPGQASDTARKVLSTIQQGFDNGVQNLGNLLQNLLGGTNQ